MTLWGEFKNDCIKIVGYIAIAIVACFVAAKEIKRCLRW